MSYAPGFFEVTAQLIPVFFLALVVEDRLRSEDDEGALERVVRTWVVSLLLVAEIAAVAVIATEPESTSGFGNFIAGVLLVAGFLLVTPVEGGELRPGRSRREKIWHSAAAR